MRLTWLQLLLQCLNLPHLSDEHYKNMVGHSGAMQCFGSSRGSIATYKTEEGTERLEGLDRRLVADRDDGLGDV